MFGSGIRKRSDPDLDPDLDPGSGIKQPGSATLLWANLNRIICFIFAYFLLLELFENNNNKNPNMDTGTALFIFNLNVVLTFNFSKMTLFTPGFL
jgi:hypothetical protein